MTNTRTVSVVTDEDRAAFERDGLLVIDSGIDSATLDAAIAEVDPLYRNGEPTDDDGYSAPRVMNAWRRCPSVREIALAPRVQTILEELFGRRPMPFQTLNFPVGTEQPIHSDTIHFNSKPSGLMCGVWIALEDADADNGPLRYYPGSHRLPELTMADAESRGFFVRDLRDRFVVALLEAGVPLGKRPWFVDGDAYLHYERMIAADIERRRLIPTHATIKKGQAVIWAANLLHGGSPRLDRSRTRHSQVTHYFFEGATTYTPLRSFGRYVYYRTPNWIR